MKPRYKRRITYFTVSAVAALRLAVVILPSFVPLNHLKPKIENIIGARVRGDVNFSVIGGRIAAHDVILPNGRIKSVSFAIPISKIFNLQSAELSNTIN